MATHQANIDNLRTATLGEQVRGSMIQLFEEDYNLVKRGINVGTAVTSASSSTAGYYDGNLYINSATLDVWECNGSVWIRQGNLKGIADITETISPVDGGVNTITITLTDGTTKVLTVKNGQKGKDGADGKSIANISLASTSGNVKTYDVLLDDGTKTPTGFSVEDGASSYLHIRYSSSFDGTGMVTTPTDATVYIGILVSTSSVAPTNPSLYNWVRFIGKSGTGSGDMLATDYATKYPNTVDKAAALYDGTDEILANQLMKKSVYDADDDGVVDLAKAANKALLANNAEVADDATHALVADKARSLESSDGTYSVSAKEAKNMYDLFHKEGADLKLSDSALSSATTTKLSKLNSDGTLDFSNVKNAPTSISGYGITDAYTKTEVDNKLDSWHKYNGSIEENTVNTTNTDETITFHSIDTSKAYELWFDTSDGQQATVKSSLISGTDITYTVNTPTAGTKFRLLVKGI